MGKKNEVQGQTRQHARLCHLLGIDQLIVGVNKMDEPSVKYSQDRYNEIKTEVEGMLTKIGYKTKQIPFIPMSGYLGVNLTEKGLELQKKEMPWWGGWKVTKKKKEISGVNLYDALERFVKPPKRDSKKPFRMPVSGVYKIKGVGDVITGRVEQGQLKPNEMVGFAPTGVTGKAFTIEMHHKNVDVAHTGHNVGINVKNLPKEANKLPKTGDVMYALTEPAATQPKQVKQFTALVFVQDHPGQLKAAKKNEKGEYMGGFTPTIHVRTAKAPCRILAINWKKSKKTGDVKVDNPSHIEANEQAEVVMEPKMPFVCAAYDDCKPLGRMAAMDLNSLIMLGRITSVVWKEQDGKK